MGNGLQWDRWGTENQMVNCYVSMSERVEFSSPQGYACWSYHVAGVDYVRRLHSQAAKGAEAAENKLHYTGGLPWHEILREKHIIDIRNRGDQKTFANDIIKVSDATIWQSEHCNVIEF